MSLQQARTEALAAHAAAAGAATAPSSGAGGHEATGPGGDAEEGERAGAAPTAAAADTADALACTPAPAVPQAVWCGQDEVGRLRLALAHINLARGGAPHRDTATATAAPASSVSAVAAGDAAGSPALLRAHGAPCGAAAEARDGGLLVVGYTMKASRERDLAKEGLLNLVPQSGVVFAPLDLSAPLSDQLPFHALLHKASDELRYEAASGLPVFGPRVVALGAWAAAHPQVALVDPLEATAKVINRTELGACVSSSLAALGPLQLPAQGGEGPLVVRVRTPHSTTVESFNPAVGENLGCSAPYIVKPVVACGTADSHTMALVLHAGALGGLGGAVPLPAVVQEFVNHDGRIYKVYVAGDKVFHAVRPSIPNMPAWPHAQALYPSGVLQFDSLKSLPTSLPTAHGAPAAAGQDAAVGGKRGLELVSGSAAGGQEHVPRQEVFERVAACLREALGLSLFGFDIIIASRPRAGDGEGAGEGVGGAGAGGDGEPSAKARRGDGGGSGAQQQVQEYVLCDLNYFPSYKGAPGAAELFRAAVAGSARRHKQQL